MWSFRKHACSIFIIFNIKQTHEPMKSHIWPCWFYFNVRFVQGFFQLPLFQLLQDFLITPINTASLHSLSPPVRDVGMVCQHWRILGQNWVAGKHEGLWYKYGCWCIYILSRSSATNELARPLAALGYLQNQCCFIYERLVKFLVLIHDFECQGW